MINQLIIKMRLQYKGLLLYKLYYSYTFPSKIE